jgi:hypothetical protein
VTDEFPDASRSLTGEAEDQIDSRGVGRPDGRQGGGHLSSEDLLEMMDTNNDKKINKDKAKGFERTV